MANGSNLNWIAGYIWGLADDRREVLPYAPDTWVAPDGVKVGYEISFNRYFYTPAPLRSLAEIRADIVAVEREAAGLVRNIVGAGGWASDGREAHRDG